MASVSLIVAPGLIVDFNVTPIMGATGSDADEGGLGLFDAPHITVRGRAVMSEVRVRVRRPG